MENSEPRSTDIIELTSAEAKLKLEIVEQLSC